MTNKNKTAQGRERDYSREHQLRKQRAKRLYADLDKRKAAALQAKLFARGVTFAAWLNRQIDKELAEDVTDARLMAAIQTNGLYMIDDIEPCNPDTLAILNDAANKK